MRLFARLFRLVWGDDVEPALRPVLAVSLAGAIAFSTGWTFIGIWAVEELGASSSELAFGFLFGAVAAAASGYLGGHLSDHLGRRPLILFGWGAEALFILFYAVVGDRVYLGLVLIALGGVFGSIGSAADQAMVADLVPPERHEAAYASVRVAQNLGVTMGPPIGGLLLIGENWPVLFVGVSALSAVAFAIAWRYLPRRGAYAPEEPPDARLVRRHPARPRVPALPRLGCARLPRLRRLRDGAADLGRADARVRALDLGPARRDQSGDGDVPPAAADAAGQRRPAGARSSSSRCC